MMKLTTVTNTTPIPETHQMKLRLVMTTFHHYALLQKLNYGRRLQPTIINDIQITSQVIFVNLTRITGYTITTTIIYTLSSNPRLPFEHFPMTVN